MKTRNIQKLFIRSYNIVSQSINRILDFISIVFQITFYGCFVFYGFKLIIFLARLVIFLGASVFKLISENFIFVLAALIFFVPIYLVCELCNRNFWGILVACIILSIIGLIVFGIFKISLLLGIIITPIAFLISIPAFCIVQFSEK